MWTDKYNPQTTKDVIGNLASINSFRDWLQDWDDVVIRGNKKQVKQSFGNWDNAPKPNAKAALISGPPGIGKSICARLVARSLGYEVLEMNASDTRSKKMIDAEVKNVSSNTSMDYYTNKGSGTNKFKKSVIIMDEIDGMGGSDRGGIAAIIAVIKETKTPIICICNDAYNQKLRSLTNYCFAVKFQKPSEKMIMTRVSQIARLEGLTIDDAGLL